jgi:dihydrofolate reductase
MGKVIYSMGVSLDGFIAGPRGEISVVPDEELQGDIGIGGADLAASFMKLDLIDEYQPVVHPVVAGGGTPFFQPLDARMELKLEETRTLGSGAVYLRYSADRPG